MGSDGLCVVIIEFFQYIASVLTIVSVIFNKGSKDSFHFRICNGLVAYHEFVVLGIQHAEKVAAVDVSGLDVKPEQLADVLHFNFALTEARFEHLDYPGNLSDYYQEFHQ